MNAPSTRVKSIEKLLAPRAVPHMRLIVLGNGPRRAIGLRGPRIPKQPSEFDTCPNEYALDPKLPHVRFPNLQVPHWVLHLS